MANTPYDSWQTHHVTHVNKSQAKGAAAIKECSYGVATISRLLQIIGLFCKRALYKRLYSAKETYNLKEPTDRSHPISKSAAMIEPLMRVPLCMRELRHA
jgi:hypothetical protein